jgi:hypothetical protein
VSRPRGPVALFVVAGLLVAVALAFVVAPEASPDPDGLNRVAIDEGFADQERNHALSDAPTAGYAVDGVDDDRLGTGLAGLIGIAATFVLCGGVLVALRRTSRRQASRRPVPGEPATDPGAEIDAA